MDPKEQSISKFEEKTANYGENNNNQQNTVDRAKQN